MADENVNDGKDGSAEAGAATANGPVDRTDRTDKTNRPNKTAAGVLKGKKKWGKVATLAIEVREWINAAIRDGMKYQEIVKGLSPLTVALLPATSDYAAAQFMKGVMLNNGDAGLIVTTPDMLTPEQKEQLQADLQNRKRAAGTADRPAFLWGNAKIDKPMISSVDLQFMENRRLNRQEIGAIYKVPESMMGFTDGKNALSAGSSVEQDRLNFIESTMTGICRRLEAAIDPIVKSFDADLYGWFDLESLPIMQSARRQRIQSATDAFNMGIPLNAINQVYQLGFPELPWGNDAYLPTNVQKVGHWVQPRNLVAAEVTRRNCAIYDGERATMKLLELLEKNTK